MLISRFAQVPSIQPCSSITNSPVTHPSGACGTSPSLMLCGHTAQCLSSAEGWMRHNSGCPQPVHALVTLQHQLTFLPGSLGKGVATAFLDRGQGCGKPTGANVPLPPRWPLGQAVPLQGGHNLAAGQQPALPRIFALPEKSLLSPVQARCDVMLMWYSSSDHSGGCREWIFLFLNPTSTLPIQLEFPLQVLSLVLLLNLKGS